MATKKQFPVDDLVKNLLTEDNTVPTDLKLFFGFIGEGKSEETITVYLDTLLCQAVEIAKEDILHSIKLSKTHSPVGGTMIWLNNATKYIHNNNQANVIQNPVIAEQYFDGNIYQQYAQEAYQTQQTQQTQQAQQTQQKNPCCPH
jgi:hypothetical protein